MQIVGGLQWVSARVALAFLALGFLVPLYQAVIAVGDDISPGCDLQYGERITEAWEPGTSAPFYLSASADGGCAVSGTTGPLSSYRTDSAADATLVVSGGEITGATWDAADDIGALHRLLSSPLAIGAGVILVTLCLAAIILS